MISTAKSEIPVTAPDPYPPIKVSGKNMQYAMLLTQDLASAKSEMTAVYQYVYQNWYLKNDYPEIAHTIMRIGEVEMHHLNILGQLIVLLGGNPKCQAAYPNGYMIWNGAMIYYNRGVEQILKNNILSEQYAAITYSKQATMVKDPCLSVILNRLSLDEEVHRHLFEKMLQQITK